MITRNRTTSTKFVIGAAGLRPLAGQSIYIGVGAQYYIGASSSPKHVVISRLAGDFVYYRTSPYTTDIQCPRDIFRDLAQRGCNTWLDNYEKCKHPLSHIIRKVLDGEAVDPVKPEDLQRVFALIRPTAPMPDAWHQFEAQFSDAIGGDISADCDGAFEVWCDRGKLAKLPAVLAGSSFEYTGFREVHARLPQGSKSK
jgi:hypothetical protein